MLFVLSPSPRIPDECACGEWVMHAVMLNEWMQWEVCFSGEGDALFLILILFHTLHTSSYPDSVSSAHDVFQILYQTLRRHSPWAVLQRKTSALVIRPMPAADLVTLAQNKDCNAPSYSTEH